LWRRSCGGDSSAAQSVETAAYQATVDPEDSILSLAKRLAGYGGGGTDCSLPLAEANTRYAHRQFAGAVLVSDNESWVGTGRHPSATDRVIRPAV
jgi:60 kDa SS-A/Ro ribonucleoprotein